jgi:hypothetical protein
VFICAVLLRPVLRSLRMCLFGATCAATTQVCEPSLQFGFIAAVVDPCKNAPLSSCCACVL